MDNGASGLRITFQYIQDMANTPSLDTNYGNHQRYPTVQDGATYQTTCTFRHTWGRHRTFDEALVIIINGGKYNTSQLELINLSYLQRFSPYMAFLILISKLGDVRNQLKGGWIDKDLYKLLPWMCEQIMNSNLMSIVKGT